MNYQLLIRGENAGSFSLDDLRQRRLDGLLTGQELVWCEGMANWAPLDSVLGLTAQAPKRTKLSPVVWVGIVLGGVLVLGMMAVFAYVGISFLHEIRPGQMIPFSVNNTAASNDQGVEEASRPIQQNPKSSTEAQFLKKQRDFRIRNYVDAYRDLGPHDKLWDADAKRLISGWIDYNYGGGGVTNVPDLPVLANKLAADLSCDDGIALTGAAVNCVEYFEQTHRYERALAAFAHSHYKAYPQLFATVSLANALANNKESVAALDKDALRLFREALSDGSVRPEDQAEIDNILESGWGKSFFSRHGKTICATADEAGDSFRWLALMLKGRFEDNLAWAARGGGFANTVTQTGWQGFHDHNVAASNSLSEAWKLHPDWPEAAGLMVYVVMGEGDAEECRQWFDRSTEAQIDYSGAWFNMRWALRPRWFGSLAAIRALGVAAIDTGRFDTDVPRKFFDCVGDIENEMKVQPGEHIYGRADIWPEMQRMYEGYIAAPSQAGSAEGWRATYAVIAYLAQHYDVSRQQLEKFDWRLPPGHAEGWGKDLFLLPLEVAARTGSLGPQIAPAEAARDEGRFADALAIYQKLPAVGADELTRKFIEHRLAMLFMEQRLAAGEWVDFLPASNNDLNWTAAIGSYTVQPGGAVDVKSGPRGSMLICHSWVGANVEIKGQMEVISSTTKDFQGGIVAGMPEVDYGNWYACRLKRNPNEGDVASFSTGGRFEGSFSAPAALDNCVNTFDFRIRNNTPEATVNGQAFSLGGRHFGYIRARGSQFMAGLGAYNDMNETVIRYSKVQMRRLGPQ